MLRTYVHSEPGPKQIEFGMGTFDVAGPKRRLKLLQYSIERSMIIDQSLADLGHAQRTSPALQPQSFRKQDVVFQMNVLVQIFL